MEVLTNPTGLIKCLHCTPSTYTMARKLYFNKVGEKLSTYIS